MEECTNFLSPQDLRASPWPPALGIISYRKSEQGQLLPVMIHAHVHQLEVIPLIFHHFAETLITKSISLPLHHYLVSQSHSSTVKQGAQVTWRSKSLSFCTGIENLYSSEDLTKCTTGLLNVFCHCSALHYQSISSSVQHYL